MAYLRLGIISMMMTFLTADQYDFSPRTQVYDNDTLDVVRDILGTIKRDGTAAIHSYAERFGELEAGQSLFVSKAEMKAAYDSLSADDRGVLERTAERIKVFAQAQLASIHNLEFPIAGGFAGHNIMPMDVAGCYAPGGRFPLPSTVFMTAIPARVAGVKTVYLASPRPTLHTLAAAYIAGVDVMLRIGGAQAIAALTYGTEGVLPCDIIVGPGNRFVTAAKQLISGQCAIDMLAGPSELAILADDTAKADVIAADLLAQAEHDTDAWPVLISPSRTLIDDVQTAIAKQLETLPTAQIASQSIAKGLAVHVPDIDVGLKILNHLASEHVEIICADAKAVASRVQHAGGLFIGNDAAEVIGDYGAGPNHTLPTGGTARYKAGLSVFNFIRMTTWIRIDKPELAQQLYQDAAALGRMEGLEGHARAADARKKDA